MANDIPWNIASLWVLIIHALDRACRKCRGRVADSIHRSAINCMRQCVNINTTVYLIVCLDTQTGVWCHLLSIHTSDGMLPSKRTQLARFMGQTWGASGADRTQVGLMLAPWTLLSGDVFNGDRTINVLQNTLSYMHIILLDFSLLRLNCRFCCKIIYMSHSYSSGLVFYIGNVVNILSKCWNHIQFIFSFGLINVHHMTGSSTKMYSALFISVFAI